MRPVEHWVRVEVHRTHVDVPVNRPDEDVYVPLDGDNARFVGKDGLPKLHFVSRPEPSGAPRLWLCEDATGLLVNVRDRRLAPAGVIAGKLRGVRYYAESVAQGDFRPGAPVTLVPEPENPHDSRAVAVFDRTRTHRAAYLNKQKARMCLARLESGETLAAVSTFGTKPGIPSDAVHIVAGAPAVISHLMRTVERVR